jgi:signal transduction histidine kinase
LNLKGKVLKGKNGKDKLLEYINKISKVNRKIGTIAEIATRASINFNTESLELTKGNLTSFIIQYVENVSKFLHKDNINIRLETREKYADFIHSFNSINIVMLFDNLFSNARKASAERVIVEIISYSNELMIKVRNNGQVLPRENVDKIFDFGFSTTGGTGVGLYHAKEIVTELGGEITLNREYRDGSEFIIKVIK